MDNDYNAMVSRYLETDDETVFGNFSREHASFIITKFLESAQYSVDIFSGSFDEVFYDSIAVKSLLEQTATRVVGKGLIRIVTLSGLRSNILTDIVNQINEKYKNTPVIEYIPARYSGNWQDINHFLVVDAKRYRLEDPHPDKFDNVKAEVCCNGRIKASSLIKQFDIIWNRLKLQVQPQ